MYKRTFILAAVFNLGCSGGARVNVRNGSASTITSVEVVAQGTTVRLGELAPGQDRTVSVCPKGESSLSLRFVSNGRQRVAPADTYLECDAMYAIGVDLKPDLTVHTRHPKHWWNAGS
jgi:hypothetical protein